MATIAEMITRICDDLSRPESEITTSVQREILSAVAFYESERFTFLERVLATTFSSTSVYSYATLVANEAGVNDIWKIDEIKITQGGREFPLEEVPFSSLFAANTLQVSSNIPDYFASYNSTVYLYPRPNQVMTVQIPAHVKLYTLLDASTGAITSNAWTNDGEELIRSRATWAVLAKKLDDFEKASLFKVMEQEALKSLRMEAATKMSSGILSANT